MGSTHHTPEEELVKGKGPRSPFKGKPPEEELVKGEGSRPPFEREVFEKLPETPIEIKMITAAPFFHVFKQQKGKIVFSFFERRRKNIEV